jgi:hypothetical protein
MTRLALSIVAVVGVLVGVAGAAQENMRDALEQLRRARQDLQSASENKEGHRTRAIEYVDKAIAEVQQGMAAANEEKR